MAGKTSGTRELWRCARCVAKVVGGCGVLALWVVVGGCGKKEGGGTGSGKEVVERVGGEESGYAEVGGRSVGGALGGAGVSAGAVAGETTGAVAGG
ncbi:MAG: hypothetical protein N2595_00910, partial [bacterium]|nr:hypothetical protein [bacterium]